MNPLLKEYLKHYQIELVLGEEFCAEQVCYNDCKIHNFCDNDDSGKLIITVEDIKDVEVFKLERPEYFI
jgi:hypothetical protein